MNTLLRFIFRALTLIYPVGVFTKEARTIEERRAVYRFRYSIYSKELNRDVEGVNHREEMVRDELDELEFTKVFYTGSINKITSTIRFLIFEKNSLTKELVDEYSLSDFEEIRNHPIIFIGRFMIAKNLRGGFFSIKVLITLLHHLVAKYEPKAMLASCKPGLVPHYRKFGLFPYTSKFVVYPDGIEIPLLGVADRRLLVDRGCFIALLVKNQHLSNFSQAVDRIDSYRGTIVEPAEIEGRLIEFYGQNEILTRTLPLIDAKDIARLGAYLLDIKTPTKIIHKGIVEPSVYFVLSGSVTIRTESGSSSEESGALIGLQEYFSSSKIRKYEAICVNASLLVMTKGSLDKLFKTHRSLRSIFHSLQTSRAVERPLSYE
ncbi:MULTISPECIES: hypothetical protein [unclassified Rhizobacter]|uniref:hypothetical protein n=1 Tax=unclassified Rhizobacter TaxID=2640088 RepID=UPI0012FB8E2A|nr:MULTISPECIES: hypothetical protein [unclassified Rhizobacter]